MSETLSTIQQIALGAPETCRECPMVLEMAYSWELEIAAGEETLESLQQMVRQRFSHCLLGPKPSSVHDATPRDHCQNPELKDYL